MLSCGDFPDGARESSSKYQSRERALFEEGLESVALDASGEEVVKAFILFALVAVTSGAGAAEEAPVLLKKKRAESPLITETEAAQLVRQCLRFGITPSQLNALARRYPDQVPRSLSRSAARPRCSLLYDCALGAKPERATANDVLSVLFFTDREACVGDRCVKQCAKKGPLRYEWVTIPGRCPESADCKIDERLECDEDGKGDLAVGKCAY